MAGGGSPSPPPVHEPSRRKHRRSSDGDREEDDEGSRHRKRHHRHHRRHHSRHGREKEAEALEEARPVLPTSTTVGASGNDADDREEGEIVEDDEEGFAVEERGAQLLESEPGEIKPDVADTVSDHLAQSGKEVLLSVKGQNEHDCIAEQTNEFTRAYRDSEVSNGKDSGAVAENESFKSNQVGNMKLNHEKQVSDDEHYDSKTRDEGECSSGRSPLSLSENDEKEYTNFKPKNLEGGPKSISPHCKDSENSTKRKREDTHESLVAQHDMDRHKSRRRSESRDNYRNYSDNMNNVSPENFREKYKVREQSPSYKKQHDEVNPRERSRSRDHVKESAHDQRRNSSHGNSDEFERRESRNQIKGIEKELVRRERERSRSHSRYDGLEDRHRSRDRNSERDRDRGRDYDRDREKYRERERERDKDRERERERDRHRARSRETVSDRERVRGGYDRDGQDRPRESHRERDRDVGRQAERDRVRDREFHGDSRHSRHDETYYHSERTRANESDRRTKHNEEKEEKKKLTREEDEEDYQEKIEQELAKQEEEDPEKIIEESRKRRLAILEKYKQQQSQQCSESSSDNKPTAEGAAMTAVTEPTQDVTASALPHGPGNLPDHSDSFAADISFSVGKSPQQNGTSALEKSSTGGLGYGTPKSERSADMFCDDIFGESPTGIRKPGKGDDLRIERSGLHDNWDDAEGYYSYRFGEVLDGRYEIIAAHGKGVFSTVVRAKDLKAGNGDPPEIAIKIIRNNDTMYKAGMEELVILKKLAGADPEDKRHCVRFLSSFKYRNHLCLVFESLHMNLREVLKKFGRNIGLKLTAVRAYAKQLFIALKHLRNCGVLHCDIKPDNMLVNEAKNVLKLCDFGNAMFAGKNEITPYLVSRFYRAPEIILGLSYDHPMDIWSVGCCLFELYNGKVLFPGPSNNDMLRLHMELKGPFPKKMLRKGAFTDRHFDHDMNFHASEEDPVTKKTMKRLLLNIKPKDIGAILTSFPEEDPKMLGHFRDLLERIFVLDPEKRITVSQALSHPFITGK